MLRTFAECAEVCDILRATRARRVAALGCDGVRALAAQQSQGRGPCQPLVCLEVRHGVSVAGQNMQVPSLQGEAFSGLARQGHGPLNGVLLDE